MSTTAGDSTRMGTRDKSGIRYRSGDDLLQVEPRRFTDKVREVAVDREAPWGDDFRELPALVLPGHGEEYDDCGNMEPYICTGCGEWVGVGRTCYRPRCPRCAPAWAARAATRAGAKIEATRAYFYAARGQSPKFHHLVLSPPEEFAVARDDPLGAGFEIVKELTDDLAVDGGLIAYHPYRGRGEDDRGFWKDVLFSGSEWRETWQEVEYSPHFHLIVVGDFVPGGQLTSKLHDRTGWTFKRITKGGDESESNVSLYDEFDLARALTYTLSHTGLYETDTGQNKAAFRYFGKTHNLAAEDHHTDKIDAAVRSVAPNTLGLSLSSTTCTRRLDEDEERARSASASTGPPSNPDPEMIDESDQESDESRQCGGKLVPAEDYLDLDDDALSVALGLWRLDQLDRPPD